MTQTNLHQHLARTVVSIRIRDAANQQRHRDIFQRSELRQQMMKLINKAQRLIAQLAARFFRHVLYIFTQNLHFASGRRIQPTE